MSGPTSLDLLAQAMAPESGKTVELLDMWGPVLGELMVLGFRPQDDVRDVSYEPGRCPPNCYGRTSEWTVVDPASQQTIIIVNRLLVSIDTAVPEFEWELCLSALRLSKTGTEDLLAHVNLYAGGDFEKACKEFAAELSAELSA